MLLRTEALTEHSLPGAMAAVLADPSQVHLVVDTMERPEEIIVGLTNSAEQVVVSGTDDAVTYLMSSLLPLGVHTRRLSAPFAFHSPLAAAAVPVFAAGLAGESFRCLTRAVYSPIEQRFLSDADQLDVLLASHLVRPVPFYDFAQRVVSEVTTVVECGVGRRMGQLVKKTQSSARALATNANPDPVVLMDETIAALRSPRATAPAVGASPNGVPPVAVSVAGGSVDRAAVYGQVQALYVEALEYPPEVFGDEVDLEADLGVDSVKQSELFARAGQLFGLPEPDEDFRLSNYPTFGAIVDFIVEYAPAVGASPNGVPPVHELAVRHGCASTPVIMLSILLDRTGAGDAGRLFLADREQQMESVDAEPGDCVLFHGSGTPYGRTPVAPGDRAASLVLRYVAR